VGQNDGPGQEAYILKPFNFPLNPSFDDDLDLERIFSFQSGAVGFLLKNNFNLSEPFTRGVPYLSRDEEKMAKQKAKKRQDKSRFDDIQLPEDDVETFRFLEKVRGEINGWRETGKSGELTIVGSI
jgi:poly(A)-specific ribonuclease